MRPAAATAKEVAATAAGMEPAARMAEPAAARAAAAADSEYATTDCYATARPSQARTREVCAFDLVLGQAMRDDYSFRPHLARNGEGAAPVRVSRKPLFEPAALRRAGGEMARAAVGRAEGCGWVHALAKAAVDRAADWAVKV